MSVADSIPFSTEHLQSLATLASVQQSMGESIKRQEGQITTILTKLDGVIESYRAGHDDHAMKIRILESADLAARVAQLEKLVASGRGVWMLVGIIGGLITLASGITVAIAEMMGALRQH